MVERNYQKYFPAWLFYLVILLGAMLRLWALSNDPPIELAKGQSLWTDPSQYVFFARNLTLFGKMESFFPSGLIFFKYSFISFLAIPIFKIIGSGFWQSNFVSSLISIFAIFIFSYLIKKKFGNFAGTITAFFAGTAYIFVLHNRVPYLENPSILFLALSIYFYADRFGDKYGMLLSGAFAACALFIGKTLAVFIIPAYVFSFILCFRKDSDKGIYKRASIFIVFGFILFTVIFGILFYIPNYMAAKNYLSENVISYYGFPDGLKSISGFITKLYTFDLVSFENEFFNRLPIISLLAMISISFLLTNARKIEEYRLVTILYFWFVTCYLFLSPWNYRPIRYELYLVLPMVGLSAIFLDDYIIGNIKKNYFSLVSSILTFSLIIFHLYYYIAGANKLRSFPFWEYLAISILLAGIMATMLHFSLNILKNIKVNYKLAFAIILILVSGMIDARYFYRWFSGSTKSIDYVNRILNKELTKDAVIIGPYAQTVTLGNRYKAEIFYFGAYAKNDSLFNLVPATHAIFEVGIGQNKSGNEEKFQQNYPAVASNAKFVDSYLIGRYYVNIYNIVYGSPSEIARAYTPSNFENGMFYYNQNKYDTALTYFMAAETRDLLSRAALYIGNIYYRAGDYARARDAYRRGLVDDCYDPKFWALYSVACKQVGDINNAEAARKLALKYAPYPGFFQGINF